MTVCILTVCGGNDLVEGEDVVIGASVGEVSVLDTAIGHRSLGS